MNQYKKIPYLTTPGPSRSKFVKTDQKPEQPELDERVQQLLERSKASHEKLPKGSLTNPMPPSPFPSSLPLEARKQLGEEVTDLCDQTAALKFPKPDWWRFEDSSDPDAGLNCFQKMFDKWSSPYVDLFPGDDKTSRRNTPSPTATSTEFRSLIPQKRPPTLFDFTAERQLHGFEHDPPSQTDYNGMWSRYLDQQPSASASGTPSSAQDTSPSLARFDRTTMTSTAGKIPTALQEPHRHIHESIEQAYPSESGDSRPYVRAESSEDHGNIHMDSSTDEANSSTSFEKRKFAAILQDCYRKSIFEPHHNSQTPPNFGGRITRGEDFETEDDTPEPFYPPLDSDDFDGSEPEGYFREERLQPSGLPLPRANGIQSVEGHEVQEVAQDNQDDQFLEPPEAPQHSQLLHPFEARPDLSAQSPPIKPTSTPKVKPNSRKQRKKRGRPPIQRDIPQLQLVLFIPPNADNQESALKSIDDLHPDVKTELQRAFMDLRDLNPKKFASMADPKNADAFIENDICMAHAIISKGSGKMKHSEDAKFSCRTCTKNGKRPCARLNRDWVGSDLVVAIHPRPREGLPDDCTWEDLAFWL